VVLWCGAVGANKEDTNKTERTMPKRPHISDALKSEVWKRDCGNTFVCKCPIPWCTTQVEYTNCVLAHNIPFAKGGPTTVDNLRITCSRCNLGMGSAFTVDDWIARGQATAPVPAPVPALAAAPVATPFPNPFRHNADTARYNDPPSRMTPQRTTGTWTWTWPWQWQWRGCTHLH
jgi:hypothetical protein